MSLGIHFLRLLLLFNKLFIVDFKPSDEEELTPTIIPSASLPESPPPYSEVDPMGTLLLEPPATSAR